MSPRPKTCMSTVSTTNGNPQAQLARHAIEVPSKKPAPAWAIVIATSLRWSAWPSSLLQILFRLVLESPGSESIFRLIYRQSVRYCDPVPNTLSVLVARIQQGQSDCCVEIVSGRIQKNHRAHRWAGEVSVHYTISKTHRFAAFCEVGSSGQCDRRESLKPCSAKRFCTLIRSTSLAFNSSAAALVPSAAVFAPASSSAAVWLTWETKTLFVAACSTVKLREDERRCRRTEGQR